MPPSSLCIPCRNRWSTTSAPVPSLWQLWASCGLARFPPISGLGQERLACSPCLWSASCPRRQGNRCHRSPSPANPRSNTTWRATPGVPAGPLLSALIVVPYLMVYQSFRSTDATPALRSMGAQLATQTKALMHYLWTCRWRRSSPKAIRSSTRPSSSPSPSSQALVCFCGRLDIGCRNLDWGPSGG